MVAVAERDANLDAPSKFELVPFALRREATMIGLEHLIANK